MITMLITIEDLSKVNQVEKFINDNNININWKKSKDDSVWIEACGDYSNVNKLYNMVVKINRNKSSILTKIKNKIVKTLKH